MAPTSQDRTLSTVRPSEVVSDPTNVLALECALRLRAEPAQHVRLCTTHQLLRMQPTTDDAGHTKHFRLFAMVDAGRGVADDGFEVAAVVAHLNAYRRLLDGAARNHGLAWERPMAVVRSDESHPALGTRVVGALEAAQPDVAIHAQALASNYYHGLRVGFGVHDHTGQWHEIVDLGVFDWVARLTSNRRHRFVASAIGIQLLPLLLAGRS